MPSVENPFQGQILEGWQVYHDHLVAAISPLTAEQLAFRLAPNLRSIMVVAAHIVAARVWWLRLVMQEGLPEIEPLVTWDDEGEPARSAAELAAGLEQTWKMIESGLQRWTAVDMQQVFYRPGSDKTRPFTRQWIIWHVLEHDLHHGGEVSFALGAQGLAGIDL
ncbi:MAG: DinB family protein [Ardenticatenaceae bacterium]|nr:DinB family protein [Ardenticatenaceae bacterium]